MTNTERYEQSRLAARRKLPSNFERHQDELRWKRLEENAERELAWGQQAAESQDYRNSKEK